MRDVEERSETLGLKDGCEPVGRIPDTTLGDLLAKLDPDDFEQPLVRQVRDMNRRRELRPVDLPCGVVTVDGKAMGQLNHDAEGYAMRQTEEGGSAFWYVRLLLLQEAKKILGWTTEKNSPELVTPWERYQGTLMRRKLYRTRDLDGWLDWKNLRQVWLVLQETATPPTGVLARRHQAPDKDWGIETEERYFATNLLWNRLTPAQILLVVRNHWSVENDCFHSLDVQWGEDRPAWCARGRAVIVLGWLRLLAYNLTQSLRRRHLRRHHPKLNASSPWRWRSLFRLIAAELPSLASAWPLLPLWLPPSPS